MEWTKKSRTLSKDVQKHSKPGVRLRIIREAKNRISDYKGSFSFKNIAIKLSEMGALDDTPAGRKVLKRFESGIIDVKETQEPAVSLMKILDVTPEFAGYTSKEEAKPKQGVAVVDAKKSSSISNKNTDGNKLSVRVENILERAISVYVKYYDSLDPSHIEILVCGDEPVPDKYKLKNDKSRKTGELWVPALVYKYSDNRQSQQPINGVSSIVLQ